MVSNRKQPPIIAKEEKIHSAKRCMEGSVRKGCTVVGLPKLISLGFGRLLDLLFTLLGNRESWLTRDEDEDKDHGRHQNGFFQGNK